MIDRESIPFFSSMRRSGQRSGPGMDVVVVFSAANTDTTIALALPTTPTRYILQRATAAMSIYDGTNAGTDWTPSKIVLRSSATGTATLWVR